jgi:hypothetical protein
MRAGLILFLVVFTVFVWNPHFTLLFWDPVEARRIRSMEPQRSLASCDRRHCDRLHRVTPG